MLDHDLKTRLKDYLGHLKQPVELLASLDDSAKGAEMQRLLDEIAELSPLITVRPDPAPQDRRPSFAIAARASSARIRFAAVPLGHEFSSLVLALLQIGGHPVRLDAGLIERIAALPGEYRFEICISLSCQNCPDVVQALNAMAAINPRIQVETIDGALFPDEVEQRGIMAVPSVFLNGELLFQGRASAGEILGRLETAPSTGAAASAAPGLSGKPLFDVLIVGGGPAGAAAAVYAARKGIRTGLVAGRFGGQLLDTMTIENYVPMLKTEGPHLAQALEQHVRAYEVDIMTPQQVESLSRDEASGHLMLGLASGGQLQSRTVILAPGARWRTLGIAGEERYRNRGVTYCPHCDGPLFRGKAVAVVGGGNSGVEAAIDLAGIVEQVTLLEFMPELRADAVLQRKLASLGNVRILTHVEAREICGDSSNRVSAIRYRDRASGACHEIPLQGVFVQIGLVPNTDFLKAGPALNRFGEIEVDARGQTSMPGVFAAGDATTSPYKQIVIAAGAGATAALSAFDWLIRQMPAENPGPS